MTPSIRLKFHGPVRVCALTFILAGCSHLLIYSPSDKYDNRVVRGEVTYIFTKEDMAENWEKMVAALPDAPSKREYLAEYQRVTVHIEGGLGWKRLIYPFVSHSANIKVGDVVDVPLYAGGPLVGRFSSRPSVSRVVCESEDKSCLAGDEGSRRGDLGPVAPN